MNVTQLICFTIICVFLFKQVQPQSKSYTSTSKCRYKTSNFFYFIALLVPLMVFKMSFSVLHPNSTPNNSSSYMSLYIAFRATSISMLFFVYLSNIKLPLNVCLPQVSLPSCLTTAMLKVSLMAVSCNCHTATFQSLYYCLQYPDSLTSQIS